MKKASKMLVVLLALVMALTICGCGGSDNSKELVGTWSLDYDMADLLAGEMGDEYADFNAPLVISICFQFNEDKTFSMFGEAESFNANFNTWVDEFVKFSTEMLYTQFQDQQGLGKEDADAVFEESYGSDIETFMRSQIEESVDANALLSEMTTNGKYDTSGNKLYMAADGEEIDKNAYDLFTVSGDSLKLELPSGADQEEILPGLAYPLTLKKTK
ncbi:MAG: hypothetical protein HFH93_11200 [Lachnospiraceae bacterium]|nr:hypothetical protein [Lachnospiraceae bacterium]